jgi:hypothetical protein
MILAVLYLRDEILGENRLTVKRLLAVITPYGLVVLTKE